MASPSVSVPLGSAFQETFNTSRLWNSIGIGDRDPEALGVHAVLPMSTQKSARFNPSRHHEQEDTMARMFVKIPPGLYQKYLASLADPETRTIANYIAGDDVKKGGIGYIDFLLQQANHGFSERVQVSETLCDSYVAFFFGHEPPKFSYSGVLLNTYEDDWTMRMFRIFRDIGRGTKLARNGLILQLKYDSMIVSGAMMNFQWTLNAGSETYCPFGFDLLVKNVSIIYGNLAPPTNLRVFDNHFSPKSDSNTPSSGEEASTTHTSAPPGSGPEGTSGGGSGSTGGTDPTGTPTPTSPTE